MDQCMIKGCVKKVVLSSNLILRGGWSFGIKVW